MFALRVYFCKIVEYIHQDTKKIRFSNKNISTAAYLEKGRVGKCLVGKMIE